MKVLVTGGSGFIGSQVVDNLLKAGHDVRVFDMRKPKWHGFEHGHDFFGLVVPSIIDYYKGSLLDFDEVRMALDGIDVVMHLAAIADVTLADKKPFHAHRVNVEGTLNVLEAMRYNGCKRIIYASSIWVYNTSEDQVNIKAPNDIYTATKLASEYYCKAYTGQYGLEHTILRYGIPYGPRHDRAVVYHFVKNALEGKPIVIEGDGKQGRFFIYVEDLADAHVRVLDNYNVSKNKTYVLDGGRFVSVGKIAELVKEYIYKAEVIYKPGRKVDFTAKRIEDHNVEHELGWKAKTTIEEGLKRYIEWTKNQ